MITRKRDIALTMLKDIGYAIIWLIGAPFLFGLILFESTIGYRLNRWYISAKARTKGLKNETNCH